MAKKSKIAKANKKAKFTTRIENRCKLCGRPKAYMRKYKMCRICFREQVAQGNIPGVTKSSW